MTFLYSSGHFKYFLAKKKFKLNPPNPISVGMAKMKFYV